MRIGAATLLLVEWVDIQLFAKVALAAKATDDAADDAAADSDDAAADTDDTAEETPEADNNKKTSDLNLTYVYLLLAAAAGSLVVVNVRRKRA